MGGSPISEFAPEVLSVTATRSVSRARLDFTIDWMVDLNILDATSIIDGQKFTLDSLGIVFDLEEAMNVRRTLFVPYRHIRGWSMNRGSISA